MTIQDFAKKHGYVRAVKEAEGDGFSIYLLLSDSNDIVGHMPYVVVDKGEAKLYYSCDDKFIEYNSRATRKSVKHD